MKKLYIINVCYIRIRGNNIKKMLSAIRDKILDWQTERAEKAVAQLQRKNERLAHYIDEALNGTNSKIVPNKQGCDPEVKTQQGSTSMESCK